MGTSFLRKLKARPEIKESRRAFLCQALAGIGTLNLPTILRLRAEAGTAPARSDTSLIFLWQDGGPSHFETFDRKPMAPAEYRGELRAIPTSLASVHFCEVLPRLARLADRLALVRSLHQPHSGHPEGSRYFITGYVDLRVRQVLAATSRLGE